MLLVHKSEDGFITLQLSRLVALCLLATFLVIPSSAFAIAPAITTTTVISNGASSPFVYVNGVNFASGINKFDFNVDIGSTGLVFDSIGFIDSKHLRFVFQGIASAGTLTIQAYVSAFDPAADAVSNTLSITVPVQMISQTIDLLTPMPMKIGDKDQALNLTATSGLPLTVISNTPSVCSIVLNKVHGMAPGTCSIRASQAGNTVYSPALDVVKSFEISAVTPASSNPPAAPNPVATKLGSFQYFPDAPLGGYVDIYVASKDQSQPTATHLQLLVPSRATVGPAVFLISAFSSDVDTAKGYFVAKVLLIDKDGVPINYVSGAYEIKMPVGAADSALYWSSTGETWQKISESESEFLPNDSHAIFFHEKDGTLAVLTDQLGIFGYREEQAPVTIASPSTVLKVKGQISIKSSGGSGLGSLNFGTTTATICTITPGGLVTGLSAGKCLITATKSGSGVFVDALSNRLTLEIKDSVLSATDSVGSSTATKKPTTTSKGRCDSFSYSITTAPSRVQANFCPEDVGKVAILYNRLNASTRKWVDKKVGSAIIDATGTAVFKVSLAISKSQFLHVFVNGQHLL